MEKVRVGIIENEKEFIEFIKEELGKVPEVAEVFSWESAEIFWRDKRGRELDLVFIDIGLPGMNGVELAGLLSVKNPEIPKIILTNEKSDELIFEALRHGCSGYILKSELDDIGRVLKIVMEKGAIITPTIAFRVLNSFQQQPETPDDSEGTENNTEKESTLTHRERQILDELVCGYTVAKVAEMLNISVYTVRNHVRNIYQKLNVKNQQEMMRKAAQMGLL